MENYPNIKKCKIALILGSGLGPFADEVNEEEMDIVKYEDIPFWKSSKV